MGSEATTVSSNAVARVRRQREMLGVLIDLGAACDRAMDCGDTQELLRVLEERRSVTATVTQLASEMNSEPTPPDLAPLLDEIDSMLDRITADDACRHERMTQMRDGFAREARDVRVAGRVVAAYGQNFTRGIAAAPRSEDRTA
jgi:hypothetical protein